MVCVRHRCRAGSLIVYHDRDASTVAAAGHGRRRVQFGAAHGARGVCAEPRVDARRVERVAADGEPADRVARGELLHVLADALHNPAQEACPVSSSQLVTRFRLAGS